MAKVGSIALRDLALGDDGVVSFLWCYYFVLCDTSDQVVLLRQRCCSCCELGQVCGHARFGSMATLSFSSIQALGCVTLLAGYVAPFKPGREGMWPSLAWRWKLSQRGMVILWWKNMWSFLCIPLGLTTNIQLGSVGDCVGWYGSQQSSCVSFWYLVCYVSCFLSCFFSIFYPWVIWGHISLEPSIRLSEKSHFKSLFRCKQMVVSHI